jgi:Zn-dependent protease
MGGGTSYYYRPAGSASARSAVTTSRREIVHLGIAYVVLTFDLLVIFSGAGILFGTGVTGLVYGLSPTILAVSATAAFTGFAAHELAHKVVAQRRGFWAEFRMWPTGLFLSVLTALAGFLWGAPGATVVGGMSESDRSDWGKTSVAGPLVNVGFGLVFLIGGIASFELGSALATWLLLLAWINGWFGTFNLIPVGPLDGRKVIRWSVPAWLGSILFTGAVAALSILAVYSLASYGNPFHYYP